jgi:RimJ/RimL family protein N-acetyltransferase
MILRQPTREECQQVRIWRNDPAVRPMLRTREPLTEAQQDAFYERITSGESEHAYFALEHEGQFVGLGGLTHLTEDAKGGHWAQAEISLIIGPEFRARGLGTMAVDLLLSQAKSMRIPSVVGECYSTGNLEFWWKQIAKQIAKRPDTKVWHKGGSMFWRWEL